MDISLVTPAAKPSRSGNRMTAERWARLLRGLGHQVEVTSGGAARGAEALIALHAWRSAGAIEDFRCAHPRAPLIVALTGTDIYRDLTRRRATVLRSLELADALVGLHDLAPLALPERFRGKLSVIHQSARPLARRPPLARVFEVLVIGHLRAEKDPLRAAYAARLLPAPSRLRITHLGRAHDAAWAARAEAEMARNPRYRWLGEVPAWQVRRALARAPLMVLSSLMEGGANVISEAVMSGVPVLASEIPGSVGLLGPDYPGYWPVRDHRALADLLRRAETEPGFLADLARRGRARRPLFEPARESAAWHELLERVARKR